MDDVSRHLANSDLSTKPNASLHQEAFEFLGLCCRELKWEKIKADARFREVGHELDNSSIWTPTFEELEFGARVAWRNNAKCIGRLFWPTLKVRDRRHIEDPELIASDLYDHVRLATNNGRIQPMISIYAPSDQNGAKVRIWNHQLFGYAGYGNHNGKYVGDPKNQVFTDHAIEHGWNGNHANFDLLPWIIQKRGEKPKLFKSPIKNCREVKIRHPQFEWFEDLGLRWYAVPILSDMNLRIGGLNFRAAPFNGWYMETEIGSRDLGDKSRYNVLPDIARKMGLLDNSPDRFWKDRALIELNEAVVHSFLEDGVRIVDHHRASSEFMKFASKEIQSGRLVSGKWSWLVPPMSGSATDVFHHEWKEYNHLPAYQYQPNAWEHFL